MLFILTICIVLCVYLKENFKGLKRVLLNSERGETRPDKDYENVVFNISFHVCPKLLDTYIKPLKITAV